MTDLSETIVAPITGTATAAVAVVRLSGPDAWTIGAKVFSPWPDPIVPWQARYGKFTHGDDGIILPFGPGQGFTGETAVEISVHGSRASVDGLLRACWAAGARPARPGEFSLRAFLNGKMDLTQAEAVRDTVDAAAIRQLRAAGWARQGGLRNAIGSLAESVLDVLAEVEARVDFDEEMAPLNAEDLARQCDSVAESLEGWAATAEAGRILREGLRVVLAGRPNAGKSSLLNALLGRERAIVTDVPGTTRDTLEEFMVLDGLPIYLIDTAGLRETQDPIEQLGMARTREAIDRADAVLYLVDATAGWCPGDEAEVVTFGRPVIRVATKCDLHPPMPGAIGISVRTPNGLASLQATLMGLLSPVEHTPEATVSARHAVCLTAAANGCRESAGLFRAEIPFDLATTFLREAVMQLGEVTGETASPDVIEAIFSRFCLGK